MRQTEACTACSSSLRSQGLWVSSPDANIARECKRTLLAGILADVDDVDQVVDVLLLLLDVPVAYGIVPHVVATVLGCLELRHALVPEDALFARVACICAREISSASFVRCDACPTCWRRT